MIYLISFFTGILNGVFASGAGQILVFYLLYIQKQETHIARQISVCVLSISSIFAIIGYLQFVELELSKVIIFSIIAVITGILGSKLMKKLPANILNLIAGILIVVFTLIKMLGGNS